MTIANDMNLRRLYAERLFLVNCILSDDYHFPAALGSAVLLTAAGEAVLQHLLEENPSLGAADAKAAIFAEFVSGGDFLVDYQSTRYE